MLKQLPGIAFIMVLTAGAMAAGAGLYKWATPESVIAPATPVPHEPNLSRHLIDGLLRQYLLDSSSPSRHCVREFSSSINNFVNKNSRSIDIRYIADSGRWAVRTVCEGKVET